MKIKLEYVWLDGYQPEPNLRSKVKVIEIDETSGQFEWNKLDVSHCPEWSFDGSSTQQAKGHFSDCVLKPVKLYPNPLNKGITGFFEKPSTSKLTFLNRRKPLLQRVSGYMT